MQTFFFTGFPGFLGSELISNLLPKLPDVRAVCLVQSKFKIAAEKAREALILKHPELSNRIDLVEGDITLKGLGLDSSVDSSVDRNTISQVFHLAAVYDLGVSRDLGMKVNVDGTINTLNFANSIPHLKCFQYVSTCYVSGRHAGVFREQDLDVGQTFNNYYEETKYLAEIEVRKFAAQGLPTITYRPAIVVGNSDTGETQKFDGPYFVMQWLLRQPKNFAVLPSIGDPDRATLNVVPSNFVTSAIVEISQNPANIGKTFQLADPNPLTIRKVIETLGSATGRKVISVPLGLSLAKITLRKIKPLQSFLKIPPATLDYFVLPTRYDTTQTQNALKSSGLAVPRFEKYVPLLVKFMKAHPTLRSQAMV